MQYHVDLSSRNECILQQTNFIPDTSDDTSQIICTRSVQCVYTVQINKRISDLHIITGTHTLRLRYLIRNGQRIQQ